MMFGWRTLLPMVLLVSFGGCNLRLKPNMNPFYDVVLKRYPDNKVALYGQSQHLERQGQFGEAAKYLQKMTRISPDNAQAWVGLGQAYLEQNKFMKAQKAFERALALKPSLEAYLGLGTAQLMNGQADQARQMAGQIEQKYGLSAELLRLRGDIELISANFAKAREMYRVSLDKQPNQQDLQERVRDIDEYLHLAP
jgi:uncharacterized protein HemY